MSLQKKLFFRPRTRQIVIITARVVVQKVSIPGTEHKVQLSEVHTNALRPSENFFQEHAKNQNISSANV